MDLAAIVKFRELCHLFDRIQKAHGRSKRNKLQPFIEDWRQSKSSFFPVLRLLLPHVPFSNAAGPAETLVWHQGKRAGRAVHHRSRSGPQRTARTGALALHHARPGTAMWGFSFCPKSDPCIPQDGLCYRNVDRPSQWTTGQACPSIQQIVSNSNGRERVTVIREFYTNMSLNEQYWLARIILKDMKLEMTEKSILPVYHADGYKLFQVRSNLAEICSILSDEHYRMPKFDIEFGNVFEPQRSKKFSPQDAVALYGGRNFWVETKLDGERIQMHYQNGTFKWVSRSRKDYTKLYGESCDEGSLAPYISDCLPTDSRRYFLFKHKLYTSKLRII